MTVGTLYEVADSSEVLFQRARSKSEWYQAMQAAGVETAPTCEGEDSLRAWEYSLAHADEGTALHKLFVGDLRTEDDGTGDPHCAFHRSLSVGVLAADLEGRGAAYFESLLANHGHGADGWFYGRLSSFLAEAIARKSAVVVLWER